jgi:O-acetyl-ADP-ribose deacetylase (regulator of RNase III)
MRVRLLARADLALTRCADAIATSANAGLVGNANPRFWRFEGRANVDGAIHREAGPALQEACDALATVDGDATRCAPGCAVVTPAFRLHTGLVIHAVAPDGAYAVGLQHWWGRRRWSGGDASRAVHLAEARPAGEADALLARTYAAILHAADAHGTRSVALPAIGCGVLGFQQRRAARLALGAFAAHRGSGGGSLERVDVALHSEDAVQAWVDAATTALGEPVSAGSDVAVFDLSRASERLATEARRRMQASA